MSEDKTTSTTYHIPKLNESNYRSWAQQLKWILDEKDLLEIVEGEEKAPDAPVATSPNTAITPEQKATHDAELAAWTKKAKKARSIIGSSVTESVMTYIEGMTDPAKMWETLGERYNPRSQTTLLQRIREFMNVKMQEDDEDDGGMEQHLQRIQRLKRQLEEQGEKVSDTVYNGVLLNSAPEAYKVAISILESQADLTPTVIINRLLEESRKTHGEGSGRVATAMLTNRSISNAITNAECSHCNKKGHTHDRCWVLHPELRPAKSGNTGKHAKTAKYLMMATTKATASTSVRHWILDTGASEHFSPHRDQFETFETLEEPFPIHTAGRTTYGTGIGSIRIAAFAGNKINTILLNNVVYAPGMGSNLLSLTLYDKGYETSLKPGSGVNIVKNGVVVADAVRQGSLFRLKTAVRASAMTARTIREKDIDIWHQRMGHLGENNVRKLEQLADAIKIDKDSALEVCGPCQKGKQHLQPSHEPGTRATEPLELIHSDTYGAFNPISVGGGLYFGLFIDDATRMTYIVPMKDKTVTELLRHFKVYKAQVENELGKMIKRLHTDGGREYEKQFSKYLKQWGIKHETTAPYSPDQNGISERASRVIVERTKAIIAGSSGRIPKKAWMEVASMVVYLKNRSPTVALSNPAMTPYEAWHSEKPDLSHLRTIGSIAQFHVAKKKRIKLDDNSTEGTLVGYGGTNQYQVWVPARNDVVVSRDVIFDEDQQEIAEIVGGRPIYDTIPVLPLPRIQQQQLQTPPRTPTPSPAPIAESESESESIAEPPKAPATQIRTSTQSTKGQRTTVPFAKEDHSKPKRKGTAQLARIARPDDEEEPDSYETAITHSTHGKQWEQAMKDEYTSIVKNDAWKLVPRPANRDTVSCKWVFKVKKNEKGYIDMILRRFSMEDSNPTATPIATGTKLLKATTDDEIIEAKGYQSIVGSQMYAMICTRPDLAFAISQISQFCANPTSTHEAVAKRVLRYLKGTTDLGITYDGSTDADQLVLHEYSDADWGAGEDRKSISGYVFTLANGGITWGSKKQTTVALSTTEAEYMALVQAEKESIWIQQLLEELGRKATGAQTLYSDNQGAIALANNPEYHARTKHIDIQYHFIRECVENGDIHLKYCPTEDMVTDGLTKALAKERHWQLIEKMGMTTAQNTTTPLTIDQQDTQIDNICHAPMEIIESST